jgi:peptidoglycan glycosyltransferase
MQISRGIRILTFLFVALFVAVSAGLVYWQVVVAQQVAANPHNSRSCFRDNIPLRGRILDRNGKVLAETLPVSYGCGYIRRYTDASLAGLIGYYAGPNYPSTGLEHQLDDYLSGRNGMTGLDNLVSKTLHRPPMGDDVYLTIDENIQKIVDRDFDAPVQIDNNNAFVSDRGSAIVSDPHTGQILAMLSRPSFDPNRLVQTLAKGEMSYYQQLASDPEQPLLERPIQSRYVPGSTYKTMTLLAGLDSGNTTLNQQFDKDHAIGPVFFPGSGHPVGPSGNNIQGYTSRFPVTTEYGFTHSDNVIFAQIGVTTGANTWLDYNRRFFVGKQIPFDLPVQPSSVLPDNSQTLDVDTLAANAFGQGVDFVTPMQMSLIDNVVANDGVLMKPMLVMKIVDPSSNAALVTNPQQSLGAQVSQTTAQEVRQAMYGVVRCGSGSLGNVKLIASQWGVIGKTGTAEVGGTQHAHAWLISQAPYAISNPTQLPKLTIVAMRENGGEGGQDIGPMTAAIYNDIFTNVQKTPPPAQAAANYCQQTGLLQF